MNIYVGNLNYRSSEEDLRTLFSQYGEVVSAKIIKDRETGRSKGFGFIEMTNDDEGEAAIKGLDQFEHQGRNLRVNEARRRENEPRM